MPPRGHTRTQTTLPSSQILVTRGLLTKGMTANMKFKITTSALIFIVGIGMLASLLSTVSAQGTNPHYRVFNYREWYLQSLYQMHDQDANHYVLPAVYRLSDTYIRNYVVPNTGEDFETAKARIVGPLGTNPTALEVHTAIILEAYEVGECPAQLEGQCFLLEVTNWAIASQILGFNALWAEVTAQDYEPDWANWNIPRPSVTDMMPTPPSLELKYDPVGVDRNCSDFTTWEEAQAFFLATEDDSHSLDQDGDKIACEDLPGAPVPVEPTPTFPTTINPGTREVGKDISVGLYRGVVPDAQFSSCTWKRWRKNGKHEYEAELELYFNEGYQFYVRVLETDYSLETNCQLTRVTDFTRPPASDLPNTIEQGMYLVGVEIKSGIYEGVVSSESFSSCSWARHADFTGAYNETIDSGFHSDEGTSFNVLVAPDDYGLATNCQLTFVQ